MDTIERMKKDISKTLRNKSAFGDFSLCCHGVNLTVVSEILKWSLSMTYKVSITVYDQPTERNYVALSIYGRGSIINLFSVDYEPDIAFLNSNIQYYQNQIDELSTKKNSILQAPPKEMKVFEDLKLISKEINLKNHSD